MRLNKPENGETNSPLMRRQGSRVVPESPGSEIPARTTTPPSNSSPPHAPHAASFEANIEAIVQAIAQANATRPAPLTSPQPNTQPSSGPSHTNTTHTPTHTHMKRLTYLWKYGVAFVRGDNPPIRPAHLNMPSLPFKACRWLWRKVGLMGLCVCVCVMGMSALLGVSVALADNYSCVGGEHTVWATGDSVWGVVSRQCSGDRQHAYDDVVTLNSHVEAWALVQGEVIVLPHSGG